MFQSKKFTELTKEILFIVPAEKIFLLASTQIEKQTESIFTSTQREKIRFDQYYLLILVSKDHQCIYSEIQKKIESVSTSIIITMEMEMFNEWLEEGHPFAVQIRSNALLIYDHKSISFSNPSSISESKLLHQRRYLYQSGIEEMQELILNRNLHAASVAGLMTILKANIGLELQTNNIDQLINYCTMLINEMPKIFPNKNYEENPPVDQIEALLHSLYAPYKTLT